jgi:hypothetical protein
VYELCTVFTKHVICEDSKARNIPEPVSQQSQCDIRDTVALRLSLSVCCFRISFGATYDQTDIRILQTWIYCSYCCSVAEVPRCANYKFIKLNSRHCATGQKVLCSIPNGVILIFRLLNSSSRTMAFRSLQALAEMSTRNISWGVKTAIA